MRKKVNRYTRDDNVFIYQMLLLRSQGLSYCAIGNMFNKHYSTVIHWCKRFKVNVGTKIPSQIEVNSIICKKVISPKGKYYFILEEPINAGKKSYSEYLNEDLKNKNKMLSLNRGTNRLT